MDTNLINANANSAYSITIRQKEASYNRDVLDHKKRQRELEKTFLHNERKLKATQRGVMSLLGQEPYPDCTPESVLFSHNLPGFCYRRNGTPRRFNSLAESETRKILDDLEGNMGHLEDPASNIVSDNPILTEVLSSPAIVQILCNLRSTAAIMKDVHLFRQFVRNIQSSPRPLRFKEKTPYDFLRQYRTDLINQFFEALQNEAESRLSTSLPETSNHQLIIPPELPAGVSSVEDNDKFSKRNESAFEEFTNALKAGLMGVKSEDFQPRYARDILSPLDDNRVAANDPFVQQQLLQLGLRQVESFKGLSPSTYGFGGKPSRGPPSDMDVESEASLPASLPPENTSEATPKKKRVSRNPKNSNKSRAEFKTFMKELITEVENVSKAGKTLRVLRGQNAAKHDAQDSANVLIKLLRKKSLFSSLNENDLLLQENVDGKAESESENYVNAMANDPNWNAPRNFNLSGGFTFHPPTAKNSNSSTGVKSDDQSRLTSAISSSTHGHRREDTPTLSERACESILTGSSDFSRCSGYKSINRVCCAACKSKAWQVCDAIRRRDKDKTKAERTQKWTNYYPSGVKTKAPRIKGIPTPAKRSYIYLSKPDRLGARRDREFIGKASQISTPMNSSDIPVAPTPVIRKNLYGPIKVINSGSGIGPYGSKSGTPDSTSSEHERPRAPPTRTPWTLKVSRLDILKLRHELDVEQIRGELEQFEKIVTRSRSKLASDKDQH